jgi:uncharacterized protein YecE (DUF72 family)
MKNLYIGTCSWKYPSWETLVYSQPNGINYLGEYAQKYNSVEVDQWFWSLFPHQKIKLPDPRLVCEYRDSVPENFRFTVKAPNSITLTHYSFHGKKEPLQANPNFLSVPLFLEFLALVAPLQPRLGPIILQFEYLNKLKMKSQKDFGSFADAFFEQLPKQYQYAVEIRNPNYWNEEYVGMLRRHSLIPVFLQGYWMPPIVKTYRMWQKQLEAFPTFLLRLHGEDRAEMERESGEEWNKIIRPKDSELKEISGMVKELINIGKGLYININNHYEGSAPLTIEKLKGFLAPGT